MQQETEDQNYDMYVSAGPRSRSDPRAGSAGRRVHAGPGRTPAQLCSVGDVCMPPATRGRVRVRSRCSEKPSHLSSESVQALGLGAVRPQPFLGSRRDNRSSPASLGWEVRLAGSAAPPVEHFQPDLPQWV